MLAKGREGTQDLRRVREEEKSKRRKERTAAKQWPVTEMVMPT